MIPDNPAAQPQPSVLEHHGSLIIHQVAAGGDVQLEGVGVLAHNNIVQCVNPFKNSQLVGAQAQGLGHDI